MILGKHSLIDIRNCKGNINDLETIKKILLDSCTEANLTVVDMNFHLFEPIGISGIVVLSESHVAIHTWPEYNFVAVDAFTCGEKMNPSLVGKIIAKKLKSNDYNIREYKRGEF